MDQLVKSVDNCARFDANAFKKEKCKNCGRHWTEHLGVIDPKIVASFQEAKQKQLDEEKRKEEEARAKAQAQKAAVLEAQQAPEDKWLFGEGVQAPEAGDDSDDDGMGFRMFTGSEMLKGVTHRPSEPKALKVVNLIDFGECDLPEESGAATGSSTAASVGDRDLARHGSPRRPSSSSNSAAYPSAGGAATNAAFAGVNVQKLQSEIEFLQHMMQNAHDEKAIQAEIFGEQLAEERKLVEQLRREKEDLEQSLKLAMARSEQVCDGGDSGREASEANEKMQVLVRENTELRSEIAAGTAAADGAHFAQALLDANEKLQALAADNERLRAERAVAAIAPRDPIADSKSRQEMAIAIRKLRMDAERRLKWLRERSAVGTMPASNSLA